MQQNTPVVCAVFYRYQPELQLLFFQRSPAGRSPRQWEFPGGKVEVGETHEAALAREIREELGLQIMVQEAIAHVNWEFASRDVGGQSYTITLYAYACFADSFDNLAMKEHIEMRWLSQSEALKLDLTAPDHPLSKQCFEHFQTKR